MKFIVNGIQTNQAKSKKTGELTTYKTYFVTSLDCDLSTVVGQISFPASLAAGVKPLEVNKVYECGYYLNQYGRYVINVAFVVGD